MSDNTNGALGGFGSIASLLQNPEVAAKLPRIMEAVAPLMEEMKRESGENGENAPPVQEAEATPIPVTGRKASGDRARRYDLLKALEPYLSDSRREALEYILKVASIIDILSEVM